MVGTGNPDVADVVAAISDEWFYTIISPWSDSANMAIIEAELDSRFGGMDMRTGHLFTGVAGTHAQLTTYGSARNNEHSSFIGVKNPPQAPYLWAAVHGAVVEFNGAIDPARPFQTLDLPGLLPPSPKDRFRREERNLLLHDGCSTFTVSQDGIVQIERVVTTYQTNAWGSRTFPTWTWRPCGRRTTCAMPSAPPWPRTSHDTSSPTTVPTSTRHSRSPRRR